MFLKNRTDNHAWILLDKAEYIILELRTKDWVFAILHIDFIKD